MELMRIKILLQKYFEAETTLEEENELIAYFNSDIVDDSLKTYISMFKGIKGLLADQNSDLGEDLMNYILESEHKEKNKYRWMWQVVTGLAASLVLVLLTVNFYSSKNQWHETFTNPDEAYAAASKTLEYIGDKYNLGLARLQPIRKIDTAVEPLYYGFMKLNSGFEQLNDIEKINEKFKTK